MTDSNVLHFPPARAIGPDDAYADRDPATFGAHFMRHLERIDIEGLHSKSAIACELAYRDAELEAFKAEIAALRQAIGTVCEGWTLPHDARKVLESALYAPRAALATVTTPE